MSLKKAQQFFNRVFLWAIVLAIFVIYITDKPEKNHNSNMTEQKADPRLKAVFKQVIKIQTLNDNQNYQAALSLAEKIEQQVLGDENVKAKWRYKYLFARGDVHWNLWHFVDAENYWSMAMSEPYQISKQALSGRLQKVSDVIADSNKERALQTEYISSPGIGPASILSGKIAVAYVFIKLDSAGKWSIKNRQAALDAWRHANQWLSGWAKRFQHTVSFSKRVFIVDKNPALNRIKINSDGKAQNSAVEIIRIAMRALGVTSVNQFIHNIKKQEQADQVILIFHINQDQRSFAYSCKGRCNPYFGEFAFVYEKSGFSQWQSMQYALAHESLHLFGADDLYNINAAKYYSPRDIMNYPSKQLSGSLIEDLTAYSVGLKNEIPNTPFPIKSFK